MEQNFTPLPTRKKQNQHKIGIVIAIFLFVIILLGSWYIYSGNLAYQSQRDQIYNDIDFKIVSIKQELKDDQREELNKKFEDLVEVVTSLINQKEEEYPDKSILASLTNTDFLPITPENLIRNSSFESGENNKPRQWNYILDSTNSNTKQSQEAIRSGMFGLKFQGQSSGQTGVQLGISQPVTKTIPGRTYSMSLYVKTVGVSEGTTLRFGFWDEYSNRYAFMEEVFLYPNLEWYRVSTTTTTSGLITDWANWYPIIEVRNHKTGAVYIDDVLLAEGQIHRDYSSTLAGNPNNNISSLLGNGSVIVTSIGTVYPAEDGIGSLGTTSKSWRDLYLSNASITENGDMTLGGSLTVNQSLIVNGETTLKGDITLGENSTDIITFNGTSSFPGGITVGENGEFVINSSGNITKLNGVSYSYPSTQGSATTVLINDGSGNLSWGTFGAASVTADSLDFAQFIDAMTLDANTSINQYDGSTSRDLRFYNSNTASELLFLGGSSGQVGIGTTNPSFTLEVNGSFNALSLNISGAQVTSSAVEINYIDGASVTDGGIVFGNGTNFTQDAANLFWDDSANRLGIGITNPTVSLAVNGDILVTSGNDYYVGSIGFNDNGTDRTTAGAFLIGTYDEFTNSASTNIQDVLDDLDSSITSFASGAGDIEMVGSMASGEVFANTDADDQWLGLGSTAGRIEFDNQATDEINLLGANVGIGTTAPTAKLHISDASSPGLAIVDTTNTVSSFMQSNDSSGLLGTSSAHGLAILTASQVRMFINASGQLGVGTILQNDLLEVAAGTTIGAGYTGSAVSAPTNGLLVEGRVGIGTTDPLYKLDVNGDIRIASGSDLYIGSIALGGTGGAGLIGVNTAGFTVTTAPTVQAQLSALNRAVGNTAYSSSNIISVGSSLNSAVSALDSYLYAVSIGNTGMWRDSNGATAGGTVYIGDTSASFAIGGTAASAPFYVNPTMGVNINIGSTAALTIGNTLNDIFVFNTDTNSGLDLFKINLPSGTSNIDNIFAIYDNNSAIFTVSQSGIESAVPHTFSAAGDVSMAYDLAFTNQTASLIESYGPLTIASGEIFENLDLTLQTYGSGDVVVNPGTSGNLLVNGGSIIGGTYASLGITAPANGLLVEGNVGIGTTNPANKLVVTHSVPGATTQGGVVISGSYSAATSVSSLDFWINNNSNGAARIGVPTNGATGELSFYTTTSFSATPPTEKVRINSTGNVGIGTTNPSTFKLQVAGNLGPETHDTYALGSDSLRWSDVYVGPSTVHIGTSTSDEYTIAYNTTNNMLGFNVNGSGNPEIVFNSSGNVGIGTTNVSSAKLAVIGGSVGIGTTSPTTSLDVGGTITALGLICTDCIDASDIIASAVGTSEIADGTVSTTDILDGTILTGDISADTILAGDIATGAVTTTEILDGTVSTTDILDGTILTGDISADTILAGDIAADAIGDSELFNTGTWTLTSTLNITGGDLGLGISPVTKLDIDTGSNTDGIRLRGLAETVEIADMYIGSGGQLVFATTNSTDTSAFIEVDAKDDQYGLIIRDSSTPSTVYANLYMTDSAAGPDYMNIIADSANNLATGLVINDLGRVGVGGTPGLSYRMSVIMGSLENGIYVRGAGSQFHGIDNSGQYCDINATNAGMTCASDISLKKDIITSSYGLDTVNALRGVSYRWKTDSENDRLKLGFIAQEVEKIVPELVTIGESGKKGINYANFAPILVNAINEQTDIFDDAYHNLSLADAKLTSQIDFLKNDFNNINLENDTILDMHDEVNSIDEEVLAHSQEILSLQNQMNDIFDIMNKSDDVASEEADISSLTARISFLEQLLLGTDSVSAASTDEATTEAKISTEVLENLTVTGKANVFELGVVGDINAGQIVVHGNEAQINSLGLPLEIQSESTNPVEIMGGKVVIETNGNLNVKKAITAKKYNVDDSEKESSSIGEGIIKAGESEIIIETTSVTESSKIFLTPTKETDTQLAIVEKKRGKFFKVKIVKEAEEDISFNWWIVN